MATSQQFEQMFTHQIVPILKQETTANTGSFLPKYTEVPVSGQTFTATPSTSGTITWVAPITTTDWSPPLANEGRDFWTFNEPPPPTSIDMEAIRELIARLRKEEEDKIATAIEASPKVKPQAKPSRPPPTKEEIFAA